jgi:polar amino acid transport system substrate-binding protein
MPQYDSVLTPEPSMSPRFVLQLAVITCASLAGCTSAPPSHDAGRPSATVVKELAPTGKLRAAINFGNPILAKRDGPNGPPGGVSVDLALELARRLGVEAELVLYTSAGRVVDGAKAGEWDIGFVAIDPARAVDIDYSAPYVIIEGAYLVPASSPITANDQVDRPGNRVVVGKGSAYDLYLRRELKQAKLVQAPTSPAVVDTMVAQGAEVAAGVKQQLQADARRVPNVRLLDGRFMVINQAMATPKGRPEGASYLRAFVEEMKSSGFVAAALLRHGVGDALVAPPSG